MSSNKSRFQMAAAGVLWTAVLACAAWAVAAHGRKEYADYTPVEILDGFTPVQVTERILLDGGSLIFTAAAQDGSYSMRLNPAFWDPAKVPDRIIWLRDVGPVSVDASVEPGSEMASAIQRNLQRAIDSGRLSGSAKRDASNVIALLGDHSREVKWQ